MVPLVCVGFGLGLLLLGLKIIYLRGLGRYVHFREQTVVCLEKLISKMDFKGTSVRTKARLVMVNCRFGFVFWVAKCRADHSNQN